MFHPNLLEILLGVFLRFGEKLVPLLLRAVGASDDDEAPLRELLLFEVIFDDRPRFGVVVVIEDAETLDGADVMQTSKIFRAWVSAGGEGRQEMRGSVFEAETGKTWVACPRYTFFARVDEESLESVVGDEIAGSGCFCKIVRPDAVFQREEEREEEEEDEDDEDEDDEDEDRADLEKRVKICQLVDLYAIIFHVDEWYNIWMDPAQDIAMF